MFKKQQGIEYIDLKSKSGQQRKFFKVKYLGSGGFARCYEIYEQCNNAKQHYAFKIIKKSTLYETKQLIERLRTEIKLHKKFSEPRETAHEHIVRFIESFETQDYIYLLLELCVNQTLNQLIRRRKFLTEEETRFYIWQLAHGLKEMHGRNVVHRDIKLCNLFLAKGLKVKIGDFGLATEIQENRKRYTLCGTANYIAPQMIQKDHNGGPIGHGYEVDVWALGVVCYTIFFGKYPFEAQQEQSIYNKVLSCKYSFNPYSMKQIKQLNINGLNHFPSDELKSFIMGIFQLDPSKRLTLDQVLAHKFLNKTTVPKEIPQISLKCPLKKDTIQKLFTHKQASQKLQTSQNTSVPYEQQKQSCNLQKIAPQPSQISQTQKHQTQSQHSTINLKKTQSCETQEEKVEKLQQFECQKIMKKLSRIEPKPISKDRSIFIKFQRQSRASNELGYENTSKMVAQSICLQLIPLNGAMQNIGIPQIYQNGLIIKVFRLNGKQGLKIQNFKSQYKIMIHPRFNYLTKVIEPPKSNVNARKPLGQVVEEPRNKEQLNHKEKDQTDKYVVKIPFRSKGCQKGMKLSKDENNMGKKYWEELNIVKMVFSYLDRIGAKAAYKAMVQEGTNQVIAN